MGSLLRSDLRGYKEAAESILYGSLKKRVSWEGVAIHRGLKYGRRRIYTVRSRYQGTAGKDTAVWKKLGMIL
jgi:hypothetical protein